MKKKWFLSSLPAVIVLVILILGTSVTHGATVLEGLSHEDFIYYLKNAQDALEKQQLLTDTDAFDGGWERVVERGFEDSGGELKNEYAWGMSTYTDPEGTEWLYVGTLNQNAFLGGEAQVFRSSDGENWEKIDQSFPGCSGVRGVTEYQGLLWLGTLNTTQGCQLWVTDGTDWITANTAGFGVGAQSTRGIMEFQGALYADAGQLQSASSAHIFKYAAPISAASLDSINPASWEDVTPTWDNPINSIGEMIEFDEDLYLGTWSVSFVGGASATSGCEVWRYTPGATPAWGRINEPGFGDPKNGAVLSMAVFNNQLYVGTQNFLLPENGIGDISELADGAEVWRWDGEVWECVIENGNPENPFEEEATRIDTMYIWRMIVYDGKLIIGTMNLLNGGELWASGTGDPGSFTLINDPGMRRDTNRVPICFELFSIGYKLYLSEQYGIRTVAEFKNKLYVGTASWASFVDWIIFAPLALGGLLDLSCPDEPVGPPPLPFYTHSRYVGCEIWRIGQLPKEGLPIGAYPNPCNLNQTQEVTIDRLPPEAKVFIYTISGELVRELEPQGLIGIGDEVTWNCKNENGELVARGIYIILVTSPTETKTGKIAIIK